jgi:hypothetical protein
MANNQSKNKGIKHMREKPTVSANKNFTVIGERLQGKRRRLTRKSIVERIYLQ